MYTRHKPVLFFLFQWVVSLLQVIFPGSVQQIDADFLFFGFP